MPQTDGLETHKEKKCTAHSSGGWKSKVSVAIVVFWWGLSTQLLTLCPYRPEGKGALPSLFYEGPDSTHEGATLVGASPVVLAVKNLPAKVRDIRDPGMIPGLEGMEGNIPGGGHGNPLQCSCLVNPMDRGAWRATVLRITESDTTEVT